MPVGTVGAVKTLTSSELLEVKSQIILGNTYHLYLKPGLEILEKAGGLHKFINWKKPILTDSGGFQVMSLSKLRKITEDGVRFQSHIDGSYHLFTPEKVMEIQKIIGADIIMVFDECPPFDVSKKYVKDSMETTIRWAKRCQKSQSSEQALFGIVQGGVHLDLRKECAERLIEMDFPGYSVGGLAVGEPKEDMLRTTEFMNEILPSNKPRYLMGVGTPGDLLDNIRNGIDMFDCVMPTRNARKGTVFTWNGRLILKAARFKFDFSPIDENCKCYTCQNYSKAYIRHLFNIKELLAMRLASIHSLHFYLELMKKARENIIANNYEEFYQTVRENLDNHL